MYRPITSVTGCGGNLTAPSGGPVTSPNYPGDYGYNENCEWLIAVPEGSIIRLTFDSFDTEERWDFLTIYDGASDNAAKIKSRIRLVEHAYGYYPHGPNERRVEVRPVDSWTWGGVCGEHFDLRDADVVCRMLGYIWANHFMSSSDGHGLAYMADIRCDGNESSLFNCSYAGWGSHRCVYGYAGVVCGTLYIASSRLNFHHVHMCVIIYLDPSRIRLIGGSGSNEGRVEVRPEDSMTWGTVCHNRFNMDDADVVCRMLGYPNATQVRNDAYFGQGTGPIYMDDVRCDGNETSLFSCSYAGWTIHDCDHGQDAGVVCRTDSSRIRLVGGSGPNQGRVEVRPADSFRWGTVCDNGFDLEDAEVVCRMLGYPNAYRVHPNAFFGTGTGPIYLEDLQCDGTESSLFYCSHKGWRVHDCSPRHGDDVGVVCDTLCLCLDTSRIRLVGGSSRKEGRIEVRPADSMTWGTVCHNQFDMKDADVVCKMLGYPSAQLVRNYAYFGPGRGPIYMDNLRCNGDENSLFNCSYPGWMINDLNCSHDQAAGVECTGEPFLLVATNGGIFQIEVKDGSEVKMSSGRVYSVDYDPKTDFMYWYGYRDIKRARRDGSGQETIVSDVARARCLRLDHAGGNVYWSDDAGHISVARKDGSFVRTLTIRTLTLQGSAGQLVLDPRNG
ncbi:PREDICTED: deleted in malignant brain tumors 1 protein-like [Branchiostoma belcheri]|uniref:Deleted in malignant brain tumors 1 protein-like n=1 Tax=Branchiostoma belcheri TaxID=7741 RepID=A0A6P4Y1Y3_BRABE|nr:PREDICTED: deleted in malignant brain tumors 1 protein-like [Branchiostoma belcheri]